MSARSDPDTLGFLITDVARLIRAEFDRRTSEAGMGLTPGEARTLAHAARAGLVRQTLLAERMGVEAMTLSTFLDRLEARGLVRRTGDPTDRRAKLVEITGAAGPVLEAIAATSSGLRADMAGTLTPVELEEFGERLKTLRANLVAMRPEGARGGAAS